MEGAAHYDHQRINEAIRYATNCHAGQCRKGSDRPYILHPLEVCCLLNEMGADCDLLIAGLLHDTLEDTSATREAVEARFGPGVTALVCAHTEDKSKSWEERKSRVIRETARGDRRLKLLLLADKLSNLRSVERDRRVVGEAIWDRFHAPRERQQWYYGGMVEALRSLETDPWASGAFRELEALYHTVFRA